MANTLNFNNLKKKYFTVTLADETKTTLMLTTPTKGVFDSFIAMKDSIGSEEMADEVLEELYDICAKLLSRNKANIVISKEKVEEIFDFEDIVIFIQAYTNFINEVTGSKN